MLLKMLASFGAFLFLTYAIAQQNNVKNVTYDFDEFEASISINPSITTWLYTFNEGKFEHVTFSSHWQVVKQGNCQVDGYYDNAISAPNVLFANIRYGLLKIFM